MDFLNFRDVLFLPNSSIGRLCKGLNNIVGQGVWYDKFQVHNTSWLWVVNDIVSTMKSDKVLCGSFGLYPSYATGNLNSVNAIHFYVICSEKLSYADYILKCIAGKEYMLLIKRIQEIISSYHRVMRHLHYYMMQKHAIGTTICAMCAKKCVYIC